jgi:hypothetical protein
LKPYTTQTGMRAHRVMQERTMAQKKMKEWEEFHPYVIDQKVPEKPKVKKPRPQTVKQKKSERRKNFRALNGLATSANDINDTMKSEERYKIPLTCK